MRKGHWILYARVVYKLSPCSSYNNKVTYVMACHSILAETWTPTLGRVLNTWKLSNMLRDTTDWVYCLDASMDTCSSHSVPVEPWLLRLEMPDLSPVAWYCGAGLTELLGRQPVLVTGVTVALLCNNLIGYRQHI